MEKAIVVNIYPLTSRPQMAVVIQRLCGYTVCVISNTMPVKQGQVFYHNEYPRGVWRFADSDDVFPANITGHMTLNEAEIAVRNILTL